jgi:DNA-directed RNA polymerase alpha subunit
VSAYRWVRHLKQVSDTIKAFLNDRIPFDELSYDALGVFSVRMVHVLNVLKVETVPDLLKVSLLDLQGADNCGRKTIAGFKKILGEYGLTLLDNAVVPSGAP